MNYQDWMHKYYPIGAAAVAEAEGATDLVLLEHAERKWTGLDAATLDEYHIGIVRNELFAEVGGEPLYVLMINDATCTLCIRHLNEHSNHGCESCPIAIARHGVPCDSIDVEHEEMNSPFTIWCEKRDTQPMLKAIRDAIQFVKEHQGEQNG